LRQPFSDPRGEREGAEIRQKLAALGLSRYRPDPLRAMPRPSSASLRSEDQGQRRDMGDQV
jgi:hypothetical protein